ncbi:hypothetical protein [Synechococcus sp. CS-1332]|uniref:hypothetical protein n=1 Tax=Synechococcus sp. CS-1332 TaxID=2847972 RepID=UPI00223BD5A1|nr:hypothetical protein [Synechococcus sp. CS-1332]MCT0206430.1 hypothetical protein [Synechococcus sp. CS-1332]
MVNPNQPVEFACLDQLVFQLHHGLGKPVDHDGIDRLLGVVPGLSDQHRKEIIRALIRASNSSSRFHPGLTPLAPGDGFYALDPAGHCHPEVLQKVEPFLLHDTFILDLSSTVANKPVSLLRGCRYPLTSSLGQCTLLTIISDNASEEFAADMIVGVLGIAELELSRTEILRGSPIREFSEGNTTHYIWIKSKQDSDGSEVQHILNMLSCRAKIDFVVQQSAICFSEGKRHYDAIESHLSQISELKISDNDHQARQKRIQILEDHLAALPDHAHQLSRCERDMSIHLLTLIDNVANARNSIPFLLLEGDTFMGGFIDQDCPIHQRQIEHDLKVLSPGRLYADQAISAIRTIVTLDSQKQQLALEEAEKAREQTIRKTLTIVGSGLTISGLAASTRPRPTEKLLQRLQRPHHQPAVPSPELLWLSDIAIHASLGLLAALLMYLIWSLGGRVCSHLRWCRRAAGR